MTRMVICANSEQPQLVRPSLYFHILFLLNEQV